MPDRTSASYLEAIKHSIIFFRQRKIFITNFFLDNEASNAVKAYLRNEGSLRFVPPGQHRTNIAERAIRTFKNHLISTIFTADPEFPLDLLDLLVPQAEVTINLLRASAVTPCISAYHGIYDYSANPFAPLGTKVLIFERASQRGTWASHGLERWYSHLVFVIATGAVRTSDTLACPIHQV
jgi:hypothetical protein